MYKTILNFTFLILSIGLTAQDVLTPEMLVQLNKVSGKGITKDGKNLIYSISSYTIETNKKTSTTYQIPIKGGGAQVIADYADLLTDKNISPNGRYKITTADVKLEKVTGQDYYNDVPKSNVKIYDALNYRHWDTWEDGAFSHVFYKSTKNETSEAIDIMAGEPFDCPQKPFGGSEDFLWSPDSNHILYVTKKLSGVDYAVSTNSDIYQYNLQSKTTTNLTSENKGYDTQPAFSSKGQLAWLQMKRDGYESDKNDIIVIIDGKHSNLTANWDGTVNSFVWQDKGDKIYFVAPVQGTVHLFEIKIPSSEEKISAPKQITNGQFDVNGIVGQTKNTIVASRRDMNHAVELYSVNLKNGEMQQLTHANDATYNSISLSKIEKRMVKTTDGKDMVTWVIYPPNFDPSKKYPTLLYCQGGPQGALSQFYSFRWNFQLMAANGYIIVAPNRRGMPGYGVEWNEQISKDYGGQNMQDYLSAIDELAKEPYVDNDRLGAIGASYGGYSVFYLAAIHEGRFKSFISHDGIFDWRSMYGTTEELFFVDFDLGGAYWDKNNKAAQKSHTEFNPAEKVSMWNTPMLIIQGGLDYRVPIGQGLAAFQAAQLQGIKSKLLFFPEENHWVLDNQNSLVWQREFYKWLKETL
ncbi:MAG: alpha/beta fold hydrolase [Lutibacter sp.]|uniref:S9 family peptidase n=1 Tax=Lutibacter sp. TaxID=1925666 RepID=UPI0019EC3FD7|nr:S9 family peptidase [Lutibacter sp.]NOR28429.1 alpha/beta fold hydrolase [Lutibacter sp.]